MPPPADTLLDRMEQQGLTVYGVGKIRDIFAGKGITRSVKSSSNSDGMAKTRKALGEVDRGLIFTNLVDFDMLYGHRLDVRGFGRALEEFDAWLAGFLPALEPGDLLVITADHGCDPTTPGTDHTRESVPLLVWHSGLKRGGSLGIRRSFADVAATLADMFGVRVETGSSFADQLG